MRTSKKFNNLGDIICFTGPMGSGKTLAAVAYLVANKPKKLYSNIPLKSLHSKPLNLNKISTNYYKNCTIFIDMAEFYLDCRTTNSINSRLLLYLLVQSRHLNLEVVLTCQSVQYLDLRVRRMLATEIKTLMKLGNTHVNLRVRDYKTGAISQFSIKATPYFSLYNTNFIIPVTFRTISIPTHQAKLARALTELGVVPGSKEWKDLLKEFDKK